MTQGSAARADLGPRSVGESGRLFASAAGGPRNRTPMYRSRQNAASLAARVRSLLGPADRAAVRRLAADLEVREGELREILEHETPYPSASVLAAIVAAYGVDAGWLLTGEYSPATHRAEEELEQPAIARVARLLDDAPLRRLSG
jgi:hypothetical protein